MAGELWWNTRLDWTVSMLVELSALSRLSGGALGFWWVTFDILRWLWFRSLFVWCTDMAMDQYLYIPFSGGWTSIYQLFWGSLGTRVLTHPHMDRYFHDFIRLSTTTCTSACQPPTRHRQGWRLSHQGTPFGPGLQGLQDSESLTHVGRLIDVLNNVHADISWWCAPSIPCYGWSDSHHCMVSWLFMYIQYRIYIYVRDFISSLVT